MLTIIRQHIIELLHKYLQKYDEKEKHQETKPERTVQKIKGMEGLQNPYGFRIWEQRLCYWKEVVKEVQLAPHENQIDRRAIPRHLRRK